MVGRLVGKMVPLSTTTMVVQKPHQRSGKLTYFLPKSRASMDQAPGPTIAKTAPRTACTMGINGSSECEKYREKAIHTLAMAASVPATGVHKPIRRSIPATAPMICRTTIVTGGVASTPTIPKWMSAAAVSTRKSRRPAPGQPLANVENSRCKILSIEGKKFAA